MRFLGGEGGCLFSGKEEEEGGSCGRRGVVVKDEQGEEQEEEEDVRSQLATWKMFLATARKRRRVLPPRDGS